MSINDSRLLAFPKELTQRAIMEDSLEKVNYDTVNYVIEFLIKKLREIKENNSYPAMNDIEFKTTGSGIKLTKGEVHILDKYLNNVSGWPVRLIMVDVYLKSIVIPNEST